MKIIYSYSQIRYIIIVFAACLAQSFNNVVISQNKGLTYDVIVPNETSECFITGDMTGWAYRSMEKISNNHYTIHITEADTTHKYKYACGPLNSYLEKDSYMNDMPNRHYKLSDTVLNWTKNWTSDSTIKQKVSLGELHFKFIESKYVDGRMIDVWLPEGYNETDKYAVLYMHDGQMLFDSTTTWNKQEWQVDEVLGKLIASKEVQKTIVVGIFNNGNKRHAEYFPQQALRFLPDSLQSTLNSKLIGGTKSDDYLRFLVFEIKPYIDKNYSTLSEKEFTYIAGSSMGGLISMYALLEYPEVFNGAACLSTHWIGTFEPNDPIPNAILKYIDSKVTSPLTHKIYFDYGTVGLDAYYEPYQIKVDNLFQIKGYSKSYYISAKHINADHSERSWAKRLNEPFRFLLNFK